MCGAPARGEMANPKRETIRLCLTHMLKAADAPGISDYGRRLLLRAAAGTVAGGPSGVWRRLRKP